MTPSDDQEEMEILKARFDTFDQEMNANADKVSTVNNLSAQLIQNEHPNSEEALARENEVCDNSTYLPFNMKKKRTKQNKKRL